MMKVGDIVELRPGLSEKVLKYYQYCGVVPGRSYRIEEERGIEPHRIIRLSGNRQVWEEDLTEDLHHMYKVNLERILK